MALVPSLQAGSQFGKYTFSKDSKYLFCCCGLAVKVFNTVNGEWLHDLNAHSKTVTGVAVNTSNILQILSCGQDGMLIYWDYLDGVKLKHYDLHMPLYDIISVNNEKKSIMMLAQTSEQRKTWTLMLWKKKKTYSDEFSKPKILIENCVGDQRMISFGCMKEYIASGHKYELAIYSMKKESVRFVKNNDKFNRNKAITCVACHPTEYCIATGLENGKIILWHNFFKDYQPVTSTMHWHALPVLCLEFTPDGSNLLSGGHESVLVRWQMNNHNQRDFKPRMGSPLINILVSPDGNLYATKHADNVIQLLDINLKILQIYRGLTQSKFGKNDEKNPIPSGLKFDPRSKTIVTNGLPGHLQFYSISLAKQLYNLDIVGQNYISPENLDQPTVITEVTCTAINDDGSWLATFEMWDDGFFSPEVRLKFWVYSSEAQTYSLNTTVEQPHEKQITSMLFQPIPSFQQTDSTSVLITTGADSCFKMWTLVDDSDIYKTKTRWNCESVGFYRGLSVTCADFSRDGSTLAIGFEHLLTIWDPDNNVVRTALSNGLPEKEKIVDLKFGSHSCSHHLIAVTAHNLISWNLLTLTIQWNIKVIASLLIRDPASDLMAFVVSQRTVCFFKPSSAEMVYTQENMSSSDILGAVFVPEGRPDITDIGWPGHSQIYVYNSNQQLITLDLPGQRIKETIKVKIAQNLPQSTLSTFMAEKLVREHSIETKKETMGKTHQSGDSFTSLLLCSNEPIATHCDKYLRSLLVKKRKAVSHQESSKVTNGDGSADDESSSSESEMETEAVDGAGLSKMRPFYDEKQAIVPEKDMDQLLSKSLEWLNWCTFIHLK